jgi:hypothetical protein
MRHASSKRNLVVKLGYIQAQDFETLRFTLHKNIVTGKTVVGKMKALLEKGG